MSEPKNQRHHRSGGFRTREAIESILRIHHLLSRDEIVSVFKRDTGHEDDNLLHKLDSMVSQGRVHVLHEPSGASPIYFIPGDPQAEEAVNLAYARVAQQIVRREWDPFVIASTVFGLPPDAVISHMMALPFFFQALSMVTNLGLPLKERVQVIERLRGLKDVFAHGREVNWEKTTPAEQVERLCAATRPQAPSPWLPGYFQELLEAYFFSSWKGPWNGIDFDEIRRQGGLDVKDIAVRGYLFLTGSEPLPTFGPRAIPSAPTKSRLNDTEDHRDPVFSAPLLTNEPPLPRTSATSTPPSTRSVETQTPIPPPGASARRRRTPPSRPSSRARAQRRRS